MTSTAAVPDLDTAGAVLGFARDRRAAADAAEADLLQDAVTWAGLHPAESIGEAVRFGDTPGPVAGPGAPLVAEFCVAEFAAAVGLPTETGKAYLGEALELRLLAHRDHVVDRRSGEVVVVTVVLHLLDDRRVVARRDQQMIAERAEHGTNVISTDAITRSRPCVDLATALIAGTLQPRPVRNCTATPPCRPIL